MAKETIDELKAELRWLRREWRRLHGVVNRVSDELRDATIFLGRTEDAEAVNAGVHVGAAKAHIDDFQRKRKASMMRDVFPSGKRYLYDFARGKGEPIWEEVEIVRAGARRITIRMVTWDDQSTTWCLPRHLKEIKTT